VLVFVVVVALLVDVLPVVLFVLVVLTELTLIPPPVLE
jgi:hypothetical protein